MKPYITESKPFSMFSLPSDGPTVRSSTISIGAASAPARISSAMSFASRVFMLAADLHAAAADFLADHRRRDHLGLALLDQHDRHALADVLARHFLEDARAGAVEVDVHGRLVGALVESRLRVVDPVAGQHDLPANEQRLAVAVGAEIVAERHRAGCAPIPARPGRR